MPLNNAHRHLIRAEAGDAVPPLDRIADALTGLLAAVVEVEERQDREEKLVELHGKADAALGRVLDVAEWHTDKARKATDYPGPGEENAIAMAKAAEVHRDAARRILDAVHQQQED